MAPTLRPDLWCEDVELQEVDPDPESEPATVPEAKPETTDVVADGVVITSEEPPEAEIVVEMLDMVVVPATCEVWV